jgi:hypothetical protein
LGISYFGLIALIPLPPETLIPWVSELIDCFNTPVTTVVNPEECQSKPNTHPNAWNHRGSEIRLKNSFEPFSSIIIVLIAEESFIILFIK